MTPLDYFNTLVTTNQRSDEIPLTEAALCIAQDVYPKIDLEAQQLDIDRLAATLKKRLPIDAPYMHRLRSLNRYFFGELGFSSNRNDFFDPDNSYLNRVLERRIGIPISLAILYLEIGQQIGLPLRGVSFPGHFLVKLKVNVGSTHGELFLDPCDGQSLSREQLEQRLAQFLDERDRDIPTSQALVAAIQEASPRHILMRLLHNLKSVYSDTKQYPQLLDVNQRLVILLPDVAEERRDRGLTLARLKKPQAALEDLNFYLQENSDAPDADFLNSVIGTLHLS